MQRRQFLATLIAGMAAASSSGAVLAQGALGGTLAPAANAAGVAIAGQTYAPLNTPSLQTVGGKIEVLEFFSYGCPHCFALEPTIGPWIKRLAPDVYFRQLPFGYIGPVEHQKLFYALEELGQGVGVPPRPQPLRCARSPRPTLSGYAPAMATRRKSSLTS